MSDPVTLYMRLLAAMRSEDSKEALPLFHPEFVAYEDPGMPYGGIAQGGPKFLELRRNVYDAWGAKCMHLKYVTSDGTCHVAAHFKVASNWSGTSDKTEGEVIVSWTFEDDLAREARVFYFDTPGLSAALRRRADLVHDSGG